MDSKSAVRTLELYEAFAETCEPMTLTELANVLDVPLSSCLHIIRTLEAHGYVYSFGPRQGYYPTQRMYRNAKLIADHDPVQRILGPRMSDLRERTGETVVLAQRVDTQAVILETRDSRHSIRYSVERGDVRPLYSTAIGKALLGGMDPTARRKLLKRIPMKRITPTTITDIDELEAQIASCEKRGWYHSDSENAPDLYALTVNFRFGSDIFALAIAGPYGRMMARLDDHAAAILEFKATLQSGAISIRKEGDA